MSPDTIDLREPPESDDRGEADLLVRLTRATTACLERHGIAKTTIDDIAREAGCSRATVYRYCDGRASLIALAIDREVDAIVAAVTSAADGATDLEDAVVAMFVEASARIRGHAALQRALALEPELILPALSFDGGDRLFAEAGRRFAPVIARFVPPAEAPAAAEWATRVFLAYVHPDRVPFAMTDPDAVRALVRSHVVPALVPVPPVPVR